MTGPARAIAILLYHVCPKNSSGAPVVSSNSSPAGLTYPPKGKRQKDQRVPFHSKPKSSLPKPTANFSTLTPNHLQTKKCPSSCITTTKLKTNITHNAIHIVLFFPFFYRFLFKLSYLF